MCAYICGTHRSRKPVRMAAVCAALLLPKFSYVVLDIFFWVCRCCCSSGRQPHRCSPQLAVYICTPSENVGTLGLWPLRRWCGSMDARAHVGRQDSSVCACSVTQPIPIAYHHWFQWCTACVFVSEATMYMCASERLYMSSIFSV